MAAALATLFLLAAAPAEAKKKPGRKSKKTEAAAPKADSLKKDKKKGYDELLKGAVTDKGLFDVHRKGTDFLFEIPDSLMICSRSDYA